MSRRPHILILHTDQQSCWTLSCDGGDLHVPTPHIDRLAREGARLDPFFCAGAVRTPSRGSFLPSTDDEER